MAKAKLLWSVRIKRHGGGFRMRARNSATRRTADRRLPPETGLRAAEEAGRAWEAELNASGIDPRSATLGEVIEAFDVGHLSSLRATSAARYRSATNALVADLGEKLPFSRIDSAMLAGVVARYRKGARIGKKTVRPHTAQGTRSFAVHIRSFVNWANSQGFGVPVRVAIPKAADPPAKPLLSDEAFERLIEAAGRVRPDDAEAWRRVLELGRFGGLRVAESIALTWNSGPVAVVRDGSRWWFQFEGLGQKNGRSERVPAIPEMAERLDRWASAGTVGRLCRTETARADNASRVVSSIFAAAGVKGSSHDLRKCFLTRMAAFLAVGDLKAVARHSSVQTTMKHYVQRDSEGLASRLDSIPSSGSAAKTGALEGALGFGEPDEN